MSAPDPDAILRRQPFAGTRLARIEPLDAENAHSGTAFRATGADGTIVEVHSGIVDESELHAMIDEHLAP